MLAALPTCDVARLSSPTHLSCIPRWKAREVEVMRDKQPLALLQGLAKKMDPPRDFRAAIAAKAKETGASGGGFL